jgi:hypothetical protein
MIPDQTALIFHESPSAPTPILRLCLEDTPAPFGASKNERLTGIFLN